MAGIHFDITATDVNFKATLDTIKSRVESASKTIENFGSDFNTDTIAQKISTLNFAISQNENLIAKLNAQISQWQTEAMQAAANGDMNAFKVITADIEDQAAQIQTLIKETNEYRAALGTIESAATPQLSAATQPVETTQFFKSQEDYEYAEQLRQKIEELQVQIGKFDGSDAELQKLIEKLSQTRSELNDVESTAAQAAAELGEKLGGRAAEASSHLYELNAAIQKQQEVVSSLESSVATAATELDRLKASTENTQEVEIAQANYDALAASLQNAQNQLINLTAAQTDAKTEFAQVTNEINEHNSTMAKMLGGYDKYTLIVGKLPQPLQMVISGMNGMTGAAKAFIATPVGAIIGAIVLALQAVSAWFNSSAEGQMAFAKASGYVSGVLGQLKEIVIAVGKAIYKAFEDPKKAVNDLWEAIKTNLVNRFTALGQLAIHTGELIKAAFTPGADTASIFKEMGNDLLQLTTGVDHLIDRTGEFVSKTNEAAKATSELAGREEQLRRDRSKWSIEEQRLENELKKLQNKAMTGTSAERVAAQKEAEKIVDQMIEKERQFAQEELDIVKSRNALTTNAQKDYDAEYEAERKLLEVEGNRTQMMMRFNRQAASSERQLESLAEKQQKALEQQRQAEIALNEKQTQLELSNRQRVIDLMEEGHDKQIAMIDQEYKEQLAKTDELANDMKQLNIKAKIETEDDGLTKQQRDQLNQQRELLEESYAKSIKDLYDNELSDYLTYEQARLKLAEEFERKRKALYETDESGKFRLDAQGNRILRKGVSQSNIENLNRAEASANEALIDKFSKERLEDLKKSIDWESVFGDLDKVATASLRSLKRKLQEFVKDQKDLSPEALKTIVDAIEQIDDKITERDPFTAMATSFTTLRKATDAEKIAQAEYNRVLKEGTSAEIEAARKTLEAAKNTKQNAIADASNAWQSSVNKAQEVYGVATSITETLGALGVELPEQLTGFINGIGSALDGLESIDLTKPMSIISGGVKAIGGLVKGIGSLFNNDSAHEKSINRMQAQIDALQKSYSNLGDEIERAYSTDASKMINQQNEMLERQKLLIQNQIKEEEAKKHTDNNRIKAWKDQIEEINDLIAENAEKAEDAIFGADVKSQIENFASAYADAWDNGTDRAESAKETVKNMMKQMVTESIKAAIKSSDSMEKIRKKLAEFYSDNVLSPWEQDYVLNMAEQLQQDLDRQFGWAESLLSGNKNNAGTETRAATAGYTTQLSEDTGTEISGRLTAAIDLIYVGNQLKAEGNSTLNNILVQHVQTNEHLSDMKTAYAEMYKMTKEQFSKIQKTLKEQA